MVAKYAAEGAEVYLVTATRGEQGWFGPAGDNPGPDLLGRIREAELLDAAGVLGSARSRSSTIVTVSSTRRPRTRLWRKSWSTSGE